MKDFTISTFPPFKFNFFKRGMDDSIKKNNYKDYSIELEKIYFIINNTNIEENKRK